MLEVGERPMIDHLVKKLRVLDPIDELFVVTNDKFHGDFQEWKRGRGFPWPVRILNDGSTEDGEKRGAIGDIHFTVESTNLEGNLIVLAGDNLFDFDLNEMVETFESVEENVVGVFRFDDESKLSRYGIVATDEDGRIVDFQEKPDDPPSNLVAMGMYLFPAEKLSLINDYLESGGNPDEPGWYITWLVENDIAYAHAFEGNWFDIGDKDSLDQADNFLTEHSIHRT